MFVFSTGRTVSVRVYRLHGIYSYFVGSYLRVCARNQRKDI